jgi:uncharacterized protein (DUF1800 family)
VVTGVPVYNGKFGAAQAERLLWRAAFGPTPGEEPKLAKKGLRDAVRSLTRPAGNPVLHGPEPVDGDGNPLAPYDAYGHDVLWWLDRMVRSNQPHVERLSLIWHDWFATGDVGSQKLGVKQKVTLRKHALGSFDDLLRAVTVDPAMLVWLSGNENTKYAPNENYGREVMELFTLGVSDPSGYPYSEDDVREQARALTGWTNDWDDTIGYVNFRFDESLHDKKSKTIFGQAGNWDWEDSCRLVLEHQAHAPYFVNRLWSHFIPTPPDQATADALASLYVSGGRKIRPVVEAILMHPDLYTGQRLVKPPVVFIVGLLKARKRYIDTDSWVWVSDLAGQLPFSPPNVAGWDETRWLDTSTLRGRWTAAAEAVQPDEIADDGHYPDANETPEEALDKALAYWAHPRISASTRAELVRFGQKVEGAITADWEKKTYRALRQNALRMLIATAPDQETS